MSEFLGALGDIFTSPAMYASAVRLGVFLAFAALGELVAEKAGNHQHIRGRFPPGRCAGGSGGL